VLFIGTFGLSLKASCYKYLKRPRVTSHFAHRLVGRPRLINVMSDWERTGRTGTGGVVPRALKSVTSLVELGSSIQAGSLYGVQLMTMNSSKVNK
jgi:hypothetical protein